MRGECVFSLLLLLSAFGYAQETRLQYDRLGSETVGAESLIDLHASIGCLEDQIVPLSFGREDVLYGKAANILYRASKTLFIDLPVDHLAMLIQHEIFGHGARCREVGYEDATYSLALCFPYGNGSGSTFYGTPPDRITSVHEQLLRTLAGNEATGLMARCLSRKWISTGRINYREATLYLLSANNLTHYILSTELGREESGNDIVDYLREINSCYYPSEYHGLIPPGTKVDQIDIDDLARDCLLALADPFLYLSLASYLYGYVWEGESERELPRLGGDTWSYLPVARFGLSPFGIEYYLDNFAAVGDWLLNGYVRIGNPVLATSWGGGIDAQTPWLNGWLKLRAVLHAWRQPDLELGGQTITTLPAGLGGCGLIGMTVHIPTTPWILAAEGGYKTPGYLAGEQLGPTWMVRVGLGFVRS